jgi:cephalosporin-C deacetylase-like acetyl esterase
MNPYEYSPVKPSFNLQLKQTTKKWSRYSVEFPIARPAPHIDNDIARGEYFQPHNRQKPPMVILIHGWGDKSLIPCRLLAKDLAGHGIACFVLYLVFHSSRLPETIKSRSPRLTSDEWFEGYQTSVIDIRQIVDWAYSREDIDSRHVAVLGISLGGFISALAMGIDKRITAGVLLVSGGNAEKIVQKSRLASFRKLYTRTEEEYNQLQSLYTQYLGEVAEKGFKNVIPSIRSFLTDPLTFAYCLRQRPVLMLNALWDEFIPREATLEFWEASGRPPIKWFPATHASIWLWYPWISRKITVFLDSSFEAQ